MTKYLQKTGPELFFALLEEIGNTRKPIEPFFSERLTHAHYTLTSDIFDIIANNNQKQTAKHLIVVRKLLVKLRQVKGVDLLVRFDPELTDIGGAEGKEEPDVFRLKLVHLVLSELDRVIDFIIDYKPIPRVPKKI
ncbi:hypothetical protein [Pedobacter nutrimenti]|uniref:hypothetical protein n=1 Tax=Pedobacter nutrimenti TaxID=1241337 RepID=UPI00292D31E1|nr:hypothetical protein [Pedobacter nutrimenti]